MNALIPPTEDWYAKRSGRKNLPLHCPLSANDKCPRYYMSQQYAAHVGLATLRLSEDALSKLKEKWEASDTFASDELSVGIWSRPDGTLKGVDGFCPEVTARLFGLFCSELRDYSDKDSRELARKDLIDAKAHEDDPRWEWMIVVPRHFSECAEFPIYGNVSKEANAKSRKRKGSLSPRIRFEVFSRDSYKCVYCGITGAQSPLQVDHRVSVANGGSDGMDNLVTACERCNSGKGARSVTDD